MLSLRIHKDITGTLFNLVKAAKKKKSAKRKKGGIKIKTPVSRGFGLFNVNNEKPEKDKSLPLIKRK